MKGERIDLPMGEFITIWLEDGNVKGVYTDLYGNNTKFDIIEDLFLSEDPISPETRHSIIQRINKQKMEQLEDESVKNAIKTFHIIRDRGSNIVNGEDPLYALPELEEIDFETKFINATNFTQYLITQIIEDVDNNTDEAVEILNGLIQDYAYYIQDVLENGQEQQFFKLVQSWMSEG